MKRWAFFLYGVTCHLMFVGVFAYMACFVGNVLVPTTIDAGSGQSTAEAVVVDLLLLLLFAVPHSIMARPAFKRIWTRIVPPEIERSTYVLIANLAVILLLWQWRGIGSVMWDVQNPVLHGGLWGLFAAGWLIVLASSRMIDHYDLFGTRQVWLYLNRLEYQPLPFRTPLFHKHIRHPLYIGWTIAFWATPTMTLGHLLFATVLTGYMAVAVCYEERDLLAHFGRLYADYKRRVPMFFPRWNWVDPEETPETLSADDRRDMEMFHVW